MDPACTHLSEFRSLHGGNPFLSLKDCLEIRHPGRASIRRDPSELPRCLSCLSPTRLFACLSCASLSCPTHAPSHPSQFSHAPSNAAHSLHAPLNADFTPHAPARDLHALPKSPHAPSIAPQNHHAPLNAHFNPHARSKSAHALAVDVDRAELFCCLCADQVYDADFDAAVVSAALNPNGSKESEKPTKLRKRRRVDYRSWAPDLRERTLIGKNATPLTPSGFPWGLRGLNNLGNTCFMSSVLQAFLHTPPLRNYFLSDRHNRFYCQQVKNGISNKKNDNGDKKSKVCLACDMDAMFSAVFSGERTPYSPAKFLYRSIFELVLFVVKKINKIDTIEGWLL